MQRRYDLDWLRIAAFGVLILYHIGMVFVPWDFHIKTAVPVEWLEPVMLLPNAWRLSLLFVISGVASRAMLGRTRNGFAGARTRRLLVPLLAGMALWVAPQAWVDVTVNHGYTESFGHFWRSDYFRFDKSLGVMVPTWNHLWFVAYLWVYSVVLAVLMLLPAPVRARAQRGFDRLFGGWRLLALPVLFLWTVRLALIDRFPETHALVDDWSMHLTYGAAFIFGVGLGPGGLLWAGIARWWKLAGIAALLAWAGVALTYIVPGADIVAAGPVVAARLRARSRRGGASSGCWGWHRCIGSMTTDGERRSSRQCSRRTSSIRPC